MCQNITIFIAYRRCVVVMFFVTCVPREESDCLRFRFLLINISSKNLNN